MRRIQTLEIRTKLQCSRGWKMLRAICPRSTVLCSLTWLISLTTAVILLTTHGLQTFLPSPQPSLQRPVRFLKDENSSRIFSFENGTVTKVTISQTLAQEKAQDVHSKDSKSFDSPTGVTVLPYARNLSEITDLVRVTNVNCHDVFLGSENATRAAQVTARRTRRSLYTSDFYINMTADCKKFQTSRGYIMSSLTEEEKNFPLAYSILVYKDPEMIERLLRAIYRPQNFYCIHVDKKSPDDFVKAMEGISVCFPNVFIASRRIDVQWSKISVIEPEIVCMKDLWRYKTWKYFINLTGQEFPLRTNLELVKIFTAVKGANVISATKKRAEPYRWKNAGPPPKGINLFKGSVHIAANRYFVDYILHNKTAHEFFNWCRNTHIPDETFFASLNYNPQLGIKGSHTGDPDSVPSLTRYKVWFDAQPCAGRLIRHICILTTGDLYRMGQARFLFANKFFLAQDQTVIGCLEERLLNNTRDEYIGDMTYNPSHLAQMDFVRNQVL